MLPTPSRPMANIFSTNFDHFLHFLTHAPGYLPPPLTLGPVLEHVSPVPNLLLRQS